MSAPEPVAFDAVVAAGGGARRLGADKPEQTVGGERLIDRVLAGLGRASRIVVVGPPRSLPAGIVQTREEPPGGGPAAALAAGLAHVRSPWTVIAGADLPFLDADRVEHLLIAARDAGGGAIFLDDGGREQWMLGAYPTPALQRAFAGVAPGSRLAPLLESLVEVRLSAGSGGPPPWWDCDTWDELTQARRWAGDELGGPGSDHAGTQSENPSAP